MLHQIKSSVSFSTVIINFVAFFPVASAFHFMSHNLYLPPSYIALPTPPTLLSSPMPSPATFPSENSHTISLPKLLTAAMAISPVALSFLLCILLSSETICSSGAFLEFSYDATATRWKNQIESVFLEYTALITEQGRVYLFLEPFECSMRPRRPAHLAGSFVEQVVVPNLHRNISNVVVTANERQLGALWSTMGSLHASLGAAGLTRSVKVSPELSLASVHAMAVESHGSSKRHWRKVMELVERSGSFVHIETEANGELAVVATIRQAVADLAALSDADTGVVFHLKNRGAAPVAVEMVKLGDTIREKTFLGLLVDVSSPRRELVGARTVVHDMFAPVTNPATTPAVTVPSTNPASPGIVTVPSTNPGATYPTNPNLPPLYPEPTTPITPTPVTTPVPATYPVMPNPVAAPTVPVPVTDPATTPTTFPGTSPVTNPATTPTTFPGTSPVTNPATTYPYGQQGGAPTTPVFEPPATMPGTVQPAAPAVAGQTWCVAKTGLMDLVVQNGLDYACGIGGADCSAIQPMGSCYNPNTLQAHASYAFNSYFQRNPTPASCDFGGAGMIVNTNPSSGTCMYQTSGYNAGYNPAGAVAGAGAGTAVGGGSGSTVLNANNPGGNTVYGSDNPAGMTGGSVSLSGSASLSCGWVLCLVWMFTVACVRKV